MTGEPAAILGSENQSEQLPEEKTSPGVRGGLVLAERVVEKIAAQCASEIVGVGGSSGGFLGLNRQADLHARPKVSVELTGGLATFNIVLGLSYPSPVTATTQRLREELSRRVVELTGVRVHQVDIRVGYLQTATRADERRLL